MSGPALPKILIASILKPTRDTRAWEKFGLSLRETNKYDINIIGFSAKRKEQADGVTFYSSGIKSSKPSERLLAQKRFYELIHEIKPDLVICCTFEHLRLCGGLKKKLGYRLIYDVQENYQLNLSLRKDLSKASRSLRAKFIRFSEAKAKVDHFILAEKCYTTQMPDKQPALVLENKFVGPIETIMPLKIEAKQGYHFAMVGTLAESYGILDGISFFKSLLIKYPFSKLTILGHVTLKDFAHRIFDECDDTPNIELNLDQNPVNHKDILDLIQEVDFLLCPYQREKAFLGKTPSKFFEAQALGTPVLYSNHMGWEVFFEFSHGGRPIDFTAPFSALEQFDEVKSATYFLNPDQWEVNWESDKKKFLNLIEKLLS